METLPVLVEFKQDEETWNTVVNKQNANEEGVVDSENGRYFIMEYPSMEHFTNAADRFVGLVQYRIIEEQ